MYVAFARALNAARPASAYRTLSDNGLFTGDAGAFLANYYQGGWQHLPAHNKAAAGLTRHFGHIEHCGFRLCVFVTDGFNLFFWFLFRMIVRGNHFDFAVNDDSFDRVF